MNVWRVTYLGVEYDVTAGDIEDAIKEFIGIAKEHKRIVDNITKIELVK